VIPALEGFLAGTVRQDKLLEISFAASHAFHEAYAAYATSDGTVCGLAAAGAAFCAYNASCVAAYASDASAVAAYTFKTTAASASCAFYARVRKDQAAWLRKNIPYESLSLH